MSKQNPQQIIEEDIFNFLQRAIPEKPVMIDLTVAQAHVAGFSASTLMRKKDCIGCWKMVVLQKGHKQENHRYFNHLQRGGLCQPTDECRFLMSQANAVFQRISQDKALSAVFYDLSAVPDQKSVLVDLFMISIETLDLNSVCTVEGCGTTKFTIFKEAAKAIANTLMKGERSKIEEAQQTALKKANKKKQIFDLATIKKSKLNESQTKG